MCPNVDIICKHCCLTVFAIKEEIIWMLNVQKQMLELAEHRNLSDKTKVRMVNDIVWFNNINCYVIDSWPKHKLYITFHQK